MDDSDIDLSSSSFVAGPERYHSNTHDDDNHDGYCSASADEPSTSTNAPHSSNLSSVATSSPLQPSTSSLARSNTLQTSSVVKKQFSNGSEIAAPCDNNHITSPPSRRRSSAATTASHYGFFAPIWIQAPLECFRLVCGYLDLEDIAQLSMTCARIHQSLTTQGFHYPILRIRETFHYTIPLELQSTLLLDHPLYHNAFSLNSSISTDEPEYVDAAASSLLASSAKPTLYRERIESEASELIQRRSISDRKQPWCGEPQDDDTLRSEPALFSPTQYSTFTGDFLPMTPLRAMRLSVPGTRRIPISQKWFKCSRAIQRQWLSQLIGVEELSVDVDLNGQKGIEPASLARLLSNNRDSLRHLSVVWKPHQSLSRIRPMSNHISSWWDIPMDESLLKRKVTVNMAADALLEFHARARLQSNASATSRVSSSRRTASEDGDGPCERVAHSRSDSFNYTRGVAARPAFGSHAHHTRRLRSDVFSSSSMHSESLRSTVHRYHSLTGREANKFFKPSSIRGAPPIPTDNQLFCSRQRSQSCASSSDTQQQDISECNFLDLASRQLSSSESPNDASNGDPDSLPIEHALASDEVSPNIEWPPPVRLPEHFPKVRKKRKRTLPRVKRAVSYPAQPSYPCRRRGWFKNGSRRQAGQRTRPDADTAGEWEIEADNENIILHQTKGRRFGKREKHKSMRSPSSIAFLNFAASFHAKALLKMYPVRDDGTGRLIEPRFPGAPKKPLPVVIFPNLESVTIQLSHQYAAEFFSGCRFPSCTKLLIEELSPVYDPPDGTITGLPPKAQRLAHQQSQQQQLQQHSLEQQQSAEQQQQLDQQYSKQQQSDTSTIYQLQPSKALSTQQQPTLQEMQSSLQRGTPPHEQYDLSTTESEVIRVSESLLGYEQSNEANPVTPPLYSMDTTPVTDIPMMRPSMGSLLPSESCVEAVAAEQQQLTTPQPESQTSQLLYNEQNMESEEEWDGEQDFDYTDSHFVEDTVFESTPPEEAEEYRGSIGLSRRMVEARAQAPPSNQLVDLSSPYLNEGETVGEHGPVSSRSQLAYQSSGTGQSVTGRESRGLSKRPPSRALTRLMSKSKKNGVQFATVTFDGDHLVHWVDVIESMSCLTEAHILLGGPNIFQQKDLQPMASNLRSIYRIVLQNNAATLCELSCHVPDWMSQEILRAYRRLSGVSSVGPFAVPNVASNRSSFDASGSYVFKNLIHVDCDVGTINLGDFALNILLELPRIRWSCKYIRIAASVTPKQVFFSQNAKKVNKPPIIRDIYQVLDEDDATGDAEPNQRAVDPKEAFVESDDLTSDSTDSGDPRGRFYRPEFPDAAALLERWLLRLLGPQIQKITLGFISDEFVRTFTTSQDNLQRHALRNNQQQLSELLKPHLATRTGARDSISSKAPTGAVANRGSVVQPNQGKNETREGEVPAFFSKEWPDHELVETLIGKPLTISLIEALISSVAPFSNCVQLDIQSVKGLPTDQISKHFTRMIVMLRSCRFGKQVKNRQTETKPRLRVFACPETPAEVFSSLPKFNLGVFNFAALSTLLSSRMACRQLRGLIGNVARIVGALQTIRSKLFKWQRPEIKMIELWLPNVMVRCLCTIRKLTARLGPFRKLNELRIYPRKFPGFLCADDVFCVSSPEGHLLNELLKPLKFRRNRLSEIEVRGLLDIPMFVFTRPVGLANRLLSWNRRLSRAAL